MKLQVLLIVGLDWMQDQVVLLIISCCIAAALARGGLLRVDNQIYCSSISDRGIFGRCQMVAEQLIFLV